MVVAWDPAATSFTRTAREHMQPEQPGPSEGVRAEPRTSAGRAGAGGSGYAPGGFGVAGIPLGPRWGPPWPERRSATGRSRGKAPVATGGGPGQERFFCSTSQAVEHIPQFGPTNSARAVASPFSCHFSQLTPTRPNSPPFGSA